MTSDFRFSVVVPTRERADTLHFTLKTILEQDFENFEVIVHDNCSSPATQEVVNKHACGRLQYFRSDTPLAMTDSWERALSFARGEFLIVIGDDDALLPHALRILDDFLREHRVPVVRWARASYHWPSHPFPAKRNSLKIPLGNSGYAMPSRAIIKRVVDLELPFYTLPMLYNSAVHRDVVATLKAKCGRVFFSPSPDLASGYAIAYEMGQYLSLDTPFSIGGTSAKSNGLAFSCRVQSSEGAAIAEEFTQLNAKAGIEPHARLPRLYLMPQIMADPYFAVQDVLFPHDTALDPDWKLHIRNTVGEMASLRPEDQPEAMKIVRKSLKNDPRLLKWFDEEIAVQPLPESTPIFATKSPRGFVEREKIMGLDPLDFGVTDVHGAALLCEKILNYGRGGFRCTIRDYHMPLRRQLRSIARLVVKQGEPVLPDCD